MLTLQSLKIFLLYLALVKAFQFSHQITTFYRPSLSLNSFAPTAVEIADALSTGVVLVAQPTEVDHFLAKSCVLLFMHGDSESQGVILERPTAFSKPFRT